MTGHSAYHWLFSCFKNLIRIIIFLGVGKDLVERDAARQALKELYVNAYDR